VAEYVGDTNCRFRRPKPILPEEYRAHKSEDQAEDSNDRHNRYIHVWVKPDD
jgi:hypothetical protein